MKTEHLMRAHRFDYFSDRAIMFTIWGFALALRLMIGMAYYNTFDLSTFNIPWAMGVSENPFVAYRVLENLDYPPLFPLLLWFCSAGVTAGVELELHWLQMFWVKLIPVVFDSLIVLVLYHMGRRFGRQTAFLLSTLWALNLAAIFNCSFWGQTDGMLLLLIALMVLEYQENRPIWGTVFFAIGCLTKLQMVYFAPLVLLELFFCYRPKEALRALGIGLAVGIGGWLPFMIGAGNWRLPFDIYLGGFDTYNYINLNAFNTYGVIGANGVDVNLSIFGGTYNEAAGMNLGGFTFNHFSGILTGLILAAVVWSYLYAKKHCCRIPIALNGLLLLNSIFMLTVKMHERYQMPALLLVLLCFVYCRGRGYMPAFVVMTTICFFNQALLLLKYYWGSYVEFAFQVGQAVFSIGNVVLFIWLVLQYKDYHNRAADAVENGDPLETTLPAV